MSLRDMILEANDIARELVEVPLWGVTVEVRGMSGADRANLLNSAASDGEVKAGDFYVEAVIATAFDPATGERIFSENDKTALLEKNAQAIDVLAKVGLRLSGMGAEAADESGATFREES